MKPIIKIVIAKQNGIHKGAVTHHHDQSATCPILHSFNIKNTMNIVTPIL